ncbi:hypothetical protein RN001_005597 [Aquatica leii]|uniref:Uncharacterized protein n=1 Tax=Aquatica leii TaxID=1421715 RepID=A0AAN7PCX1_9COLE|nr:hypothetical protein RN001_005597 [Aquatica leii]
MTRYLSEVELQEMLGKSESISEYNPTESDDECHEEDELENQTKRDSDDSSESNSDVNEEEIIEERQIRDQKGTTGGGIEWTLIETGATYWKINVKRKSRWIKEEIARTEGGPKINKLLSDLEERLLNLISKAHLGNASLPDSLGHEESRRWLGEIEEPEVIDLAKENGDEVKRFPSGQSSDNGFLTSIASLSKNLEVQ